MAEDNVNANVEKEVKRPELKLPNKDNEKDEPQKAGAPAYKKRAEILKEIADDNREKRDADIVGQSDEEAAEELSAKESEPQEKEPEAEVETKTEPQKRKFIIDGKELELTDDEITTHVQKSATADKRLKEATELLQQAKHSRTPLPASPSNADVSGDYPQQEDAAALAKALMYGNEEQATEAIAKVLGRGRQSGDSTLASQLTTQTKDMPREQIASVVNEAMAFHLAKESLDKPPEQGGFGDIWNDPMMKQMFIQKESELRDSGDIRPYKEVYSSIATELRSWREGIIKKFAPQTTGLEDRDKQKAQTGVVRAASGRPPVPQESKPKTHDEKLESIRRARGQAN